MDIYDIEDLMDDLYSGRITRETFRHKMEVLLWKHEKEISEDFIEDHNKEYENDINDLQHEVSDLEDENDRLEEAVRRLDKYYNKFVKFLVSHNLDPQEALRDNE